MLLDAHERQRFIQEIDRNFSVLAPAGVGKTQSIVERLVNLARAWGSQPKGRVAVVTYTQKAALEMQERVEAALKALPQQGEAFRKIVFFGTLHSLALHLLNQYGSLNNFPQPIQLIEDPQAHWEAFAMSISLQDLTASIPHWAAASPFISIRAAFKQCRVLDRALPEPKPIPVAPTLDLSPLEGWVPVKSTLKRGVEDTLIELQTFADQYDKRRPLLEIPVPAKGGEAFIEAVNACLNPFRDLAANAWHHLFYQIQQRYKLYRKQLGQVTYDDMIEGALSLVDQPTLQALHYHVLLDEAQDTDANQLLFLQKLAGMDMELGIAGPGRFVMVGDPQQSIYGMRADLPTYLALHEELQSKNVAEALQLQVTFRCDEALIENVNAIGPQLFSTPFASPGLQVQFQPLCARPSAPRGGFYKLPVVPTEASVNDPVTYEADRIALFLKNHSHLASDLSQIALLCPRNEWLKVLADALHAHGIPFQLHARGKTHRESIVFAWMLGLLRTLSQPEEAFEAVGVLRELFGMSDDLLAEWVHSQPSSDKNSPHPLSLRYPRNTLSYPERFMPLIESLDLLEHTSQAIMAIPPRQALQMVCEKINFRGRLEALPVELHSEEWDLLQSLLEEASGFEMNQQSLENLIHTWGLRLDTPLEASGVELGKVQLLSCHSSKGLEWETVILPYFFRPIGYKVDAYPQWLSFADQSGFRWDAGHKLDDLQHLIHQDRKAQQARLLYVALTRAKHQLILMDDEALWEKTDQSFANTLHIREGEANRPHWDTTEVLQENCAPFNDNAHPPSKTTLTQAEIAFTAPVALPDWLFAYPKRQLPSANQGHGEWFEIEVEAKASQAMDERPLQNALILRNLLGGVSERRVLRDERQQRKNSKESHSEAVSYGNTWHEMMATCPWAASKAAWESHFTAWIPKFEASDRAEVEIQRFLSSSLITKLERFAPFIRTEVPFIWHKDAQTVFEGAIDCFAYDPDADCGWVLDWKTNLHATPEGLLERYAPQILAYQAALQSRYPHAHFEGLLYATALGEPLEIATNFEEQLVFKPNLS
jgi:ATP-dependent helicase/nuclease subunit A